MSSKLPPFLTLLLLLVQNVYQLPILKPNRENIPFKTILSVDGGGVRAAIPLAILIELENKIKTSMVQNAELLISNGVFSESVLEILHNGTDAFTIQLADFFDMAAGVSAGSIVTAYIATRGENAQGVYSSPPGTAAAGLELFSKQAPQIFEPEFFRRLGLTSAQYSENGIDTSLQEIFGPNTALSSIENITYFVTSFELENSRTIFFFADGVLGDDGLVVLEPPITIADQVPNIEQPNLEILNQSYFRVWETVRCSAAAPTLLPAHIVESTDGEYKGTCIDGAVIANNPDLHALTYLSSRQGVSISDIAVLSLGQGVLVYDLAEGRSLDRGTANWVADLLTILLDGGMEAQEVLLDTIFYQNLGVAAPQYLRIQLRNRYDDESEGLPELDDVEAIPDLVKIGEDLAKLYDEYLDQFVARFLLGTEQHPPPRF